ncbi:MAG TPA: hypothetical protein VNA57_01040 [Acidimicrobiales bacterium]|nr:hypothetical protein [Acidimicrobiales bacterium]
MAVVRDVARSSQDANRLSVEEIVHGRHGHDRGRLTPHDSGGTAIVSNYIFRASFSVPWMCSLDEPVDRHVEFSHETEQGEDAGVLYAALLDGTQGIQFHVGSRS